MRSDSYKSYMLTVLLTLLAFNFVDRSALGLVLQEIKIDLKLSDTQLGLMTGIAFAAFYSVMGIPIARWADQGNRVTLIALTAGIWSVAVALCGVATSFAQLLMIRSAVAIGEAGGYIPGYSLIADYYSRAERPRAVAIYSLGAPLSTVLAFLVAGWLNEFYGWRVMFVLLGIPGFLLAIVVRLTLREPRKFHNTSTENEARSENFTLKEVVTTIFGITTFRHLLICLSIWAFFFYGISQWQPTFFIRSFGYTTGQIGTWLALTYGLAGILGTYIGGALASRYAVQNECLQLRAVALVMVGSVVLSIAVYLSPSGRIALALLGLLQFLITACTAPLYATLQTLVPERMRAFSIAVVLLFANLIGMGFGPLATGALSDALYPSTSSESLRYALTLLSPGYLFVAWFAWLGSRTVGRDLAMDRILSK